MEDLKRKEQMKEAAQKRKEKLADMEAKKQIKARIEADKAERRRRAEEAKAVREGNLSRRAPLDLLLGRRVLLPLPQRRSPRRTTTRRD